ncbi:hypothetical protein IVB08_22095 [Bradyrhizobium sp. 173]|uniref:hypothetical protein n=1 Tax=Bradyrhizobium sp. 173 TaxID=2782644 RepID=UPI001FF9AA50|nr:hypothetical protein [Bradyrhizobium sp. 173]MCK1566621.1 hypothetical protein [Bradyrhizobium sp. 173]
MSLIILPLALLFELALVAFAASGVIWWLPLLPTAVVVVLVGRIAILAIKPGTVGITVIIVAATAALGATYSVVTALLIDGLVESESIKADLRRRIELTRAITLTDAEGRLIGILPPAFDPVRAAAPYLAVTIRAEEVPPVFWQCAKFLEDRDIGEPWHILGIDFRRLGTAVLSKFLGSRAGASTLAEMVDRSIGSTPPNPRQSILFELPRKLMSWRDLPGLSDLYPTEDTLKGAVATHLTLMTPGPGARFGGGEIHGVVLAAVVLGKRVPELTAAEQALLAAAINLPLLIGNQATWQRPRQRADYCLAHAPLGDGFAREQARKELAAIKPRDALRHPAAAAADRLGGRIAGLVRELTETVGSDWPNNVASIALSLREPPAGLPERMRWAAQQVERQQGGRLNSPLWSGADAALVYGVVADSVGTVLATVSNSDVDISESRIPIGSVGKIAAALALAGDGTPNAATRSAFGRSDSKAIMAKLRPIPSVQVSRAFTALGWRLPPGRSSKRSAVYGAVEIEPARVLRAIIALNDLVFGNRTEPVALARMIRDVELVDGRHVGPSSDQLHVTELRAILSGGAKSYVASVLGAPLSNGTMRVVGAMLKKEGAGHIFGKSGTADVGAGGFGISSTRALWNVGALTIGERRLSFVLVVVSRDGRRPLGFVQSPALAPMTIALLRHAIDQIKFRPTQTIGRAP